jgi:hypothetical protein
MVPQAAELLAVSLRRGQRLLRPLRDHAALLLGHRGVNVQHEWIGLGAEISDDEADFVLHQAADEVHVTAEPIELRDNNRRLGLASGFQRGTELRPLLIVVLAGLNLGEGLDNLDAFLIGETPDQGLLRLQAEAGLALLLGRDIPKSPSSWVG